MKNANYEAPVNSSAVPFLRSKKSLLHFFIKFSQIVLQQKYNEKLLHVSVVTSILSLHYKNLMTTEQIKYQWHPLV